MEFKYSLIIPTRQRTHFLGNLLKSIFDTTEYKQNLEIIFICDIDDESSQNKIKQYQEEYKACFDIKLFTRERTIMLNQDYYNYGASKAIGDFIWVLGDDVLFMYDKWDININRVLGDFVSTHPDRIMCVSIKDNTPKPSHTLPKFPCFPMFSKEAFQLTGMLLYPKVPTWGADYVCYRMYEPTGRLLEISDGVYLNHVSWHTKQVQIDETAERIGQIFNTHKNVQFYNIERILREEVPSYTNKIKEYISNYRSQV